MKKQYIKLLSVLVCIPSLFYSQNNLEKSVPSKTEKSTIVSTNHLQFAAPANDDCTNAISITMVSSASNCSPVTVNTNGATASTDSSVCWYTSLDDDVWYSFSAITANAVIKVTNQSIVSGDIGYAVYSDSCKGPELFCDSGDSLVLGNLTVSKTYFIRTFYTGTTDRGTYEMCVYAYIPPPPPANDDCANAITLTSGSTCSLVAGDVTGATESVAPINCSGTSSTGLDVWYKFSATSATQAIKVVGSSSFDAVVSIYPTCGGSSLQCADKTFSGGTETLVATGLAIGTNYYVRVYSYGSSIPLTPTFDICVKDSVLPPPPANDDCANATLLAVGATSCNNVTGTVYDATQSTAAALCAGFTSSGAIDVWYKFVATATFQIVEVKGATSFDGVVFLLDTCGSTSNIIDCADNTVSGGLEVINAVGLTIGKTYLVRVYSYGSIVPTTPTFNICVHESTTGIANVSDIERTISMYPNPANDKLNIGFHSSDAITFTMKIVNMNGQVVMEQQYKQFKGQFNEVVNLSSVAQGVYSLQVISEKETVTKRLVIAK